MRIMPFHWRLSSAPLYSLAMALPVSMALISIFKLLAFTTGLVVLCQGILQKCSYFSLRIIPVYCILALLGFMALSVPFSSVDTSIALPALAKYGKLLLIPIALILLRSRQQALYALLGYIVFQTFVVLSSWLLFLGVKLPYIPAGRNHFTVVFSSSLDQSILTAGFVVLCWHLAKEFPGRYGRHVAYFLAALGTLNIFFALYGRSGQACLLAAICLTAYWAMSKKTRLAVLILPFVILYAAGSISPQFNKGISDIKNEVRAYQQTSGKTINSSSGLRIEFWGKSLLLMTEKPMLGHGIGSWKHEYNRLQHNNPNRPDFSVGNPHQEFLLVSVQLGALGLALYIAWLISIAWHAKKFDISAQRATQCFLIVFVVASMFNSALYDGLVGDYFCSILGILLALGAYPPADTHSVDKSSPKA